MKYKRKKKIEKTLFVAGAGLIMFLIFVSTLAIHLVFNKRVDGFNLEQVFAEDNLWDTSKGLLVSALLVALIYLVSGQLPESRVFSLRPSTQLLIYGLLLLGLGIGIALTERF